MCSPLPFLLQNPISTKLLKIKMMHSAAFCIFMYKVSVCPTESAGAAINHNQKRQMCKKRLNTPRDLWSQKHWQQFREFTTDTVRICFWNQLLYSGGGSLWHVECYKRKKPDVYLGIKYESCAAGLHMQPNKSIHCASPELNLPIKTMYRVLHQHLKLYVYRMQTMQSI